ncbi:hypothetical protein [Pedobacter sp. SYSU D00535]|uniref:hypothetical protein n=1 Tax=Pedobacter sp. SYSU D00535 TaxID=2810308 RepID=UPI001A974336|nr:hypothetical protein [Pedobacter sp. SYSU D00535]
MADKIIIEVGLDPGDYGKRASEIIKQTVELKDQQVILAAQGKKNSLEYEQNKLRLQELAKELKANVALSQNYDGSITGLRSRLALLNNEWIKLSEAQRENSVEGQALSAQMLDITNKLKEQEGATGNNTRNVGNYKEAVAEATAQLVPFGDQILQAITGAHNLAGGITTGTTAMKGLRIAMASLGIGLLITLAASLVNYLSKFKPLTDAIERGMAAVGAVFEAVGNAIFNLIDPIKSFFIDPLRPIKELGNSIQTNLINRFKAFGVIIDAIKRGSLRDITDGVIQLGTGITNTSKRLEKFANGVKTSAQSISAAAREAANLVQKTQDLEDAERTSVATLSELRLARDKYAVQAKNVSLSEAERIRLLNLATQKEKQAADLEVGLARQRLKLIQEEIALDLKRNGGREISDELQEKLANQQAKVNDLQAASLKFTEKRYNDEAKLREKAQADREKELEKIREADQERIDSLLRTNELILSERERELQSIDSEIDEKVKKYKKYGRTTEQLEAERVARIKQLRDNFLKEDLAQIDTNNRQVQDLTVALIKDADQRAVAQQRLANDRRLAEQDKLIEGLIARSILGEENAGVLLQSALQVRNALVEDNANQLNERLKAIDDKRLKDYQDNQLALAQAAVDNANSPAERLAALQTQMDLEYEIQVAQAMKLGQDTFAIHEQYAAKQKALDQEVYGAAAESVNQFGTAFQDVVGKNSMAAKLAANAQLRMESALFLQQNARLAVEQLLGVTTQLKQPFPANVVAVMSTLALVAKIASAAKNMVTVPKFADGGLFESDGRGAVLPGYSRVDNTNAKLRSGEAVIVAEAAKDPGALRILSAINESFGGRPLVGPGSAGYQSTAFPAFAAGGIYAGNAGTTVAQNILNPQDIAAAVGQEIRNLTVVTDVRDVVSALDKRNSSINSGVV